MWVSKPPGAVQIFLRSGWSNLKLERLRGIQNRESKAKVPLRAKHQNEAAQMVKGLWGPVEVNPPWSTPCEDTK
jgi:hypothetical protein